MPGYLLGLASGGRVLRSTAANFGRGFGYLLVGLGLLELFDGQHVPASRRASTAVASAADSDPGRPVGLLSITDVERMLRARALMRRNGAKATPHACR